MLNSKITFSSTDDNGNETTIEVVTWPYFVGAVALAMVSAWVRGHNLVTALLFAAIFYTGATLIHVVYSLVENRRTLGD